ncbi:PfkB family carbohydrate kinase [Rugosimonospora africana]|uniref:Sugar kinase n=1 Tax=Rugosimonospora africana TaxID=556532 RepID=A0A8J3QZ13_9ACTN|nr:PfkB family carbohydrate kinase [Rugosimonospora africana]GIH18839.1 sugar kinase [Rugosimonospora africana]
MSAPRPGRLLLVGSVLVDIRMAVPALPERGGDRLADRTDVQTGGGFNVLVAAVRNGMPAALAGRLGAGPFGRQAREDLDAAGIPVLLDADPNADTGFSVTLIEPDGERTFVTSPGAESVLTAERLAPVEARPDDAVYVSGYDLCYPRSGPAIAGWLRGLPPSALLVFDPGPVLDQIPAGPLDAVLARTDVLTLNQRETALLAATDDPAAAARTLAARLGRAGSLIVLRRGPAATVAVWTARPGELLRVPVPAVTAVDTTGAGDTHTGVLIAALHAGHDWPEALRRAGVGAAISVTRDGSATAPAGADIDAFEVSSRR